MSATQNIRRKFVLLRFLLLNQLSGARSCIWLKCSCGASPCWGFCGVYPAVQFYVGGKLSTRRGLISDWHTQKNPHFVFLKSWNCFLGKLNRNRYLKTKTRLTFVHQSDYILTTFWQHSDYILTTFWLHSDFNLTTFWLHFGQILATFWPISG